jgi:YD repeat-containing protein
VQYTYDAANQLRSVIQINHPDPSHNTTAYTYDGKGNLITSTDANTHATQTGFHALSQLKTETLPLAARGRSRIFQAAAQERAC